MSVAQCPTTAQLAKQLGMNDKTLRCRMHRRGIRVGDLTAENIARLSEPVKVYEAPVRVAPGAVCVCGSLLAPGRNKWFCSAECRRASIEAVCESLARLRQQGGL